MDFLGKQISQTSAASFLARKYNAAIVPVAMRTDDDENYTLMIFNELKNTAIVRELHIYGRQKTLDNNEGIQSNTQHLGFGRQLMNEAERLSKKANFKKIAVIAAIGTRAYYKKLGYNLEGTYMTKSL